MALNYPQSSGVNFVPEYQISSVPYGTTGAISAIRTGTFTFNNTADVGQNISFIRFPRVTRWMYMKNTAGATLTVYFNEVNAANKITTCGYILPAGGETAILPWRVQKLYFHSDEAARTLVIAAGLTTIPGPLLSGSIEAFTSNFSSNQV